MGDRDGPDSVAAAGRGGERSAAEWPLLWAILILAAVLRAIRLDSGLWFDEVATLVEYVRLPLREIVGTYTTFNNHIVFSVLARLSIEAFGESAWSLRLPALLLGVASIAALWWLARPVVGRRQTALACLLLAVSYHHVWFSQNARGYTGLLLLVILGTGLFLEGLRRPRRGVWAGYALTFGLALYMHLSAAFAFTGHGIAYLALLFYRRSSGRTDRYPGAAGVGPLLGFAGGLGVALLLYAPLATQLFDVFTAQSGVDSENAKVATWTDPRWLVAEIVRSLHLGAASLLGVLVLAGLAAVGWLALVRREPLLALVAVLPVPVALCVLLALSFHLWPRYFFSLSGFGALFVVMGAFAAGGALARARGRDEASALRTGTLLASLLVAASVLSLPGNYRHPKQDYPGARDFVEQRLEPGDSVVSVGLAILPYQRLYAPGWQVAETLAELDAIAARSTRTWLVYAFPDYLRGLYPEIATRVDRDFEEIAVFRGTVGGGDLHVMRSAAGR